MNRRRFMASLSATIALSFRCVARAEMPRDEHALYAKVTKRGDATATLTLAIMPKETKFEVEGNVVGLQEGDFVSFHIDKNVAKLKDRELQISSVKFVT